MTETLVQRRAGSLARLRARIPRGASSMERLPTERALTEHTRRFTGLRIAPRGAR